MTIVRSKITDLETVPEAYYIFESPDGGKTVYKREAGSDEKVLVIREDSEWDKRQKTAMRANRLLTIMKVAENDITLNDALEQLEALYLLKYGHETNDKDN